MTSSNEASSKRIILYIVVSLFIGVIALYRFYPQMTEEVVLDVGEDLSQAMIFKDEFSKLNYILNFYKESPVKIVYDGRTYGARWSWRLGKRHLKEYPIGDEKAEVWIRQHTYRTGMGNVIYFRYPDGSKRPMRDVFLEKLDEINNRSQDSSETAE